MWCHHDSIIFDTEYLKISEIRVWFLLKTRHIGNCRCWVEWSIDRWRHPTMWRHNGYILQHNMHAAICNHYDVTWSGDVIMHIGLHIAACILRRLPACLLLFLYFIALCCFKVHLIPYHSIWLCSFNCSLMWAVDSCMMHCSTGSYYFWNCKALLVVSLNRLNDLWNSVAISRFSFFVEL